MAARTNGTVLGMDMYLLQVLEQEHRKHVAASHRVVRENDMVS